jgi:hypothetical protein
MRAVYAVALVSSVSSVAAAEPRIAAPPTVVTRAWMHDMNDASWPIEAMVDRHRGLIVLERVIDVAGEDTKGVVSANKYCGAELDSELRVLRARLGDLYKPADTFSCQNKPTARCSFASAFEYMTIAGLGFDKASAADASLRLTLVSFLDGGALEDSFYKEQARWVDTQLAKLGPLTCGT